MVINYEVDPNQEFQKAIKKASKDVDDLTIPFGDIASSWYKSNRAIFALKGPGKYADLSELYKPRKKAAVGFLYPILKRSGALEKSITEPSDRYAINRIVNKMTLILGSSIPYGPHHQFGTKHMPARPWVLIGAEQTAPEELNRRLGAWIQTIENYVVQKSLAAGVGAP